MGSGGAKASSTPPPLPAAPASLVLNNIGKPVPPAFFLNQGRNSCKHDQCQPYLRSQCNGENSMRHLQKSLIDFKSAPLTRREIWRKINRSCFLFLARLLRTRTRPRQEWPSRCSSSPTLWWRWCFSTFTFTGQSSACIAEVFSLLYSFTDALRQVTGI